MSRRKKPVSPQQIAANRANAAKSTGPRTPEGKARSAANSRKHGFTAADFAVVRLEDLQAVANLRADLIAAYHPVNSQELFAVERIALAQQALIRAARLEAGFFTNCLDTCLDDRDHPFAPMTPELVGGIEVTRQQNRNYALADGFDRMIKRTDSWKLFLRYQAQTERHYRRAIEEFERLKALRHELPNEPNYDPQTEPKETTSTSPDQTQYPPSISSCPGWIPDPVTGRPTPCPVSPNSPLNRRERSEPSASPQPLTPNP